MIRSESIKKKQETRTDSRKSNRTLGQIQEEVIENKSRFKKISYVKKYDKKKNWITRYSPMDEIV